MFDYSILISAFLIGLMGAGHCIGMCGGLVAALSFALPAGSVVKKIVYLFAFSIGRVASYTLIGLAAGFIGWSVFSMTGFPYARILAGLLLILLGLYYADWWRGLAYVESAGSKIWQYIKPIADKFVPVTKIRHALFLGALWGWLPCGLIYTALTFAFTHADTSPYQGAYVMFFFGLGTLPAIIGGGFATNSLLKILKSKNIRRVLAVGYIVFGLAIIYFALAHASHGDHSSHGASPHSQPAISQPADGEHSHHQHH